MEKTDYEEFGKVCLAARKNLEALSRKLVNTSLPGRKDFLHRVNLSLNHLEKITMGLFKLIDFEEMQLHEAEKIYFDLD